MGCGRCPRDQVITLTRLENCLKPYALSLECTVTLLNVVELTFLVAVVRKLVLVLLIIKYLVGVWPRNLVVPMNILGLGPEWATPALLETVLKKLDNFSRLRTNPAPWSDELTVRLSFTVWSPRSALVIFLNTLLGFTRASTDPHTLPPPLA